jgi:hypothetical protein
MKHYFLPRMRLRILIPLFAVFSLTGICFSSHSMTMAKGMVRADSVTFAPNHHDSAADTSRAPKAQIEGFVMAHDCYQDSVPGINFYITFNTQHMKGSKGTCVVYMYYDGEDPKPVRSNELGRYTTADGQVSVGRSFQPRYDRATYRSYKLFLPYSLLGRRRILEMPLLALARIYSVTDSSFIEEQSKVISFTYK